MGAYDSFETGAMDIFNNSYGNNAWQNINNNTYGTNGVKIDSSLSTSGTDFNMDSIIGNGGKIIGAAASLGNIYIGLKQLDIAEEELGIKKEQWAMSKEEVEHMRATRKRLTASYMGQAGPTQAKANYANAAGPGPTQRKATMGATY